MSIKVPEFKSWDELNDFLESASSEELHALAVKHAECWASLSYCDEDQMLWDETAQHDELIFTRVLVAPNIDSKTLQLALETGSENTWHRALLSSTIMRSPAVTEEILLQIPADDMIDDLDVATALFFHTLASIDVLLYVLNQYPNNLIDALIYEEERDITHEERERDGSKRDELRKQHLRNFKAKWENVSISDRKPTQVEQEEFDEFLALASTGSNS
jgi:hypothetical protein